MSPAQGFGPVQMLVLEFDRTRFDGAILPELERLKEQGIIRIVDLLVRGEAGRRRPRGRPEERPDAGPGRRVRSNRRCARGPGHRQRGGDREWADAGAAELEDGHLFDDAEAWYLADAIPEGGSAAIVLIEHRWAIPLRDKIVDAGGVALADEWIHPADLIAIGAAASTPDSVGAPA